MEKQLYELLQVAVGVMETISHKPTPQEWKTLFKLSNRHTITGICFSALCKLSKTQGEVLETLPQSLKLEWIAATLAIRQANDKLNHQCVKLQEFFANAGFRTCILKGQGVASYYNDDLKLLRQSGDIDIWVDADWKDVMKFVNSISPNREFDLKHTHLSIFNDTTVEVHWWPSRPVNPLYKKQLFRYYKSQAPIQCRHIVHLPSDNLSIFAPEAKFEFIHVLYHIFNHFLYEGIGLRQMTDLYFVLVNGNFSDEDKKELKSIAHSVGLGKVLPASMWVLEKVFCLNKSYAICEVDAQMGRTLLDEIELGGNFGRYNKENQVRNESFFERMLRRLKRRAKLIEYNFFGFVCSPFTKIYTMIWKQYSIKKFNL